MSLLRLAPARADWDQRRRGIRPIWCATQAAASAPPGWYVSRFNISRFAARDDGVIPPFIASPWLVCSRFQRFSFAARETGALDSAFGTLALAVCFALHVKAAGTAASLRVPGAVTNCPRCLPHRSGYLPITSRGRGVGVSPTPTRRLIKPSSSSTPTVPGPSPPPHEPCAQRLEAAATLGPL